MKTAYRTLPLFVVACLGLAFLAGTAHSQFRRRPTTPPRRPTPPPFRPGTGAIGGRPGSRPGGITGGITGGIRGGRPGGGIPGGMMQKTWTCPKCGRVVGTGITAPVSATCCGVTYINGRSLTFGRPAGGVGRPPSNPTTRPVAGGARPNAPRSKGSSSSLGVVFAVIGIAVFGLAILGGLGILIYRSQSSGATASRRPSRRRRDDDEY